MNRVIYSLCLGLGVLGMSACTSVPSPIQETPKNTVAMETVKPLTTEFTDEQEVDFVLDVVDLELKNHRLKKAADLLQKLKRYYPDDVRVYRRYVAYYRQLGDKKLAYVSAKTVLQKSGTARSDQATAARLALLNEDYAMADKIYQAWLDSDDRAEQVAAYNNLGFSALMQKKLDRAREYFELALALDPLHEKARHNLALVDNL